MAQPRRFLTAEWRWLAMLNYEVPSAALLPFAPAGTELDSFNGITYASVVGFLFLDTRVLGWAVPFHRDFEEVNLRFYVRRKGPDGWRRGVVFIKEMVPRRAIATVARALYGENYVRLAMRHRVELPAVSYEWRVGGRWSGLSVRACGEAAVPAEGTTEQFITEHYWGYTKQRRGPALEYSVKHPAWRVWQVAEANLNCEEELLYGPAFAEVLSKPPRSAFLAEGSAIEVYRGALL